MNSSIGIMQSNCVEASSKANSFCNIFLFSKISTFCVFKNLMKFFHHSLARNTCTAPNRMILFHVLTVGRENVCIRKLCEALRRLYTITTSTNTMKCSALKNRNKKSRRKPDSSLSQSSDISCSLVVFSFAKKSIFVLKIDSRARIGGC